MPLTPEAEKRAQEALDKHFAKKRENTLTAIKRGLGDSFIEYGDGVRDKVAEDVLAELEAFWRGEETFT